MGQSIGKFIKNIREKKNMTLLFLEEKSGVSNSHISRIERGLREPSPETLKKLAKPLGVSYEKLLSVAGYLDEKSEQNDNKKEFEATDAEIEELMNRFNVHLDGEILTEEDKESVINFLRMLRDRDKKKGGE